MKASLRCCTWCLAHLVLCWCLLLQEGSFGHCFELGRMALAVAMAAAVISSMKLLVVEQVALVAAGVVRSDLKMRMGLMQMVVYSMLLLVMMRWLQ
jgi:hypothetical protein